MRTLKRILHFCSILLFISCTEESTTTVSTSDIIEHKILYSKNPKGHNELYKLENGVESVIMSDANFDFWWPKVSPDGTKLLVYRSAVNTSKNHDDYQNAELLLANIDGSGSQVLIATNENGWNAQGVCRWNRDGSKILMCAEMETDAGMQWRLIVTDALGNDPTVLADNWAIDCNFSRDDDNIVYVGFTNNELSFDLTELELQMGDYDASNQTIGNIRTLTLNNSRDHDPSFSPDNTKIVFSGGNAQYSDVDLLLYDLQSNEESVLLNDANANGGSMCWSPEGDYVYFHSLEVLRSPFRIKRINLKTKVVETVLESEDNNFGFYHPEVY